MSNSYLRSLLIAAILFVVLNLWSEWRRPGGSAERSRRRVQLYAMVCTVSAVHVGTLAHRKTPAWSWGRYFVAHMASIVGAMVVLSVAKGFTG